MSEFTAYEVQAILHVSDEATPAMERVLGLAREIEAQFKLIKQSARGLFAGTGAGRFTARLDKIDPALAKISDQMKATRDVTIASFEEMTTSMRPMLETARALKGQLVEAAGAVKAMRLPSSGGGAGGGGRMRTSTSLGLVAGGAMAYGAWEEMQLRDTVARALFLSGQPLSDMPHQQQFSALRKQILDVYSLTGANIEDIEEASLSSVKLMAGFPLDKRMQVLKTALTFGAQEARINPNVSVTQGADALIGLLHMTGQYDPDQIAKLTPKIAALSTITNLPLSTVMRAASYSMPIAQANLGVDADQILLLMTAMQRAGITNTKSGTWLREAITKTVTDTFTLSRHGSSAQRAGLQQLGLLDSAGRSTVIDVAGHLDLMHEMEIINQARQHLQGPQFLRAMREAFGAQGSEGWAVLTEPQVLQQLPQLRQWMNSMPGGERYFGDMFDASTLQQGKATFAEFNRSLMDVGSHTLPAVSDALKGFDAVLQHLNKTLEGIGVPEETAGQISSWGMLGGTALLLSPALRRAFGRAFQIGKSLLGGGGGAEGAAALGPEAAAGADAMEVAGLISAGSAGLIAAGVGGGIAAGTGAASYFGNKGLAKVSGGEFVGVDPFTGIPIAAAPGASGGGGQNLFDIIVNAIVTGMQQARVNVGVNVKGTVQLDGTTVGRMVGDAIARDSSSIHGISGFDDTRGYVPPY